MVIAQHCHARQLPFCQRGKHLLPRRIVRGFVHRDPGGRAEPFGEQTHLAHVGSKVIRCERARRTGVERHQRIDRLAVGCIFCRRVLVQPVAHPVVAEVLDQHQPGIEPSGMDRRRAQALPQQPLPDMKEGTGIFMWRRGVHQHGAGIIALHTEIAPEAGIAGQRLDQAAVPAGLFEKGIDAVRQGNAHGIRPSQSAPPSTIARRP